jgi:gliding motility-associated-like protein
MKSFYIIVYFAFVLPYSILAGDDFPTASFTATTVCQGLPSAFTNTSTTLSGSIVGSIWDFGDGQGSSAQNPEHVYLNPGDFSVTLTVINSIGDVDDFTATVTVHPAGSIDFTFNGGSQCVNTSINFTNLSNVISGNFVSTTWDLGDGMFSAINNPSHSYAAYGIYDVKLVQTTNHNCIKSATHKVEIFPLPVTDFQGANTCVDNVVGFLNMTHLPVGTNTFQWDFGDGTGSVLESPQKLFATPNTFFVSVTATSDHGCVASKSRSVTIHPAPVVDFAITNHCFQSNAVFVNSTSISSGGISSFNWDFGNGTNSLLMNPTIIFSSAGNYTVSLKAVSTFGCETSLSKNVTVYPKPVVDFTTTDECLGISATFGNNSFIAEGALAYVWDFNDGTNSIQTNPQHNYALPGSYAVNLLATSIHGCTATVTYNHNVHPKPVADFALPDLCQGATTEISNTSTIVGGTISYDWDFGDGNSAFIKNPNYQFGNHGNFTVSLVVTSAHGCQQTKSRQVFVHALPIVDFSVDNVCDHVAARFKNNTFIATDNFTYQWDFGDASGSQVTNPSHLYNSSSDYQVTLTSTSAFGCSAYLAKTVSVHAVPIASFTLADVCLGTSIATHNTSSIANGVNSFKWDFDDAASSVVTSPTHDYSQFGNYNVKLSVTSDHGCVASANRIVLVHAVPIVDFNVSNACVGSSINLVNNSFIGQGPLTYAWEFSDGSTSTFASPAKTYSSHGDYDVKLTVSSDFGCVTTSTKPVSIFPLPISDFTIQDHCFGTEVTFTNASTILQSTLSFEWDFGDGKSSDGENPTKRFDRPGNYSVTLSASSTQQCKSSKRRYVYVNSLPIADFLAKNVCDGQPVNFINMSTTGPGVLSSVWDFGNGKTSALKSPEHLYDRHETYDVTLTVTSSLGNCTATTSKQIEVNEKPVARFLATSECLGSSTQFENQTMFSSNAINYDWSFGNGATSKQKNPAIEYTTAQIYPISLLATATNGCADSFAANVSVFQKPKVAFQVEDVCHKTPSRFMNFSSINSGALNYAWDFGDGSTSVLEVPDHEYQADGKYSVILTATSDKGCIGSDQKNIIIYPLPKPSFVAPPVCEGNETHFSNSSIVKSGAIVSVLWDFGDGTNSVVTAPTKIYANSGTYQTRLTSTSDKNCQSTFLRPVLVHVLPVANFSVNDVCLSEIVTFINASSINEGHLNYKWTFGDGDISNATSPSHLYTSSSVYVISLLAKSNQGCVDSASRPVVIYAPPIVNAGQDQVISQGYAASLRAYGASNYSWSPVTGLDNSTISNPTARPLETTSYTVTATDSRGCTGADDIVVAVNEEFKIFASNILTPDDNGMNDTWKIENVETFGDVFVRVFDRWGNLVYEKETYQNDWRGESGKDILPDGTYYYYISFGSSDKIYKGSLTLLRNK